MAAAAEAQQKPFQVDIANMPVGAAPPGFEFTLTGSGPVSAWKVISDPTAVGQKAIAQTSQDRTDYRFPLAVYLQLSAANVDVTVHFKPVAGEVDQAGGIAVRLADRDNYYVARANALEDNVRFYRVVNGRRQQIQGANLKVASNQWHTLGLRAEGNRFTVSFDGKPLYTGRGRHLLRLRQGRFVDQGRQCHPFRCDLDHAAQARPFRCDADHPLG